MSTLKASAGGGSEPLAVNRLAWGNPDFVGAIQRRIDSLPEGLRQALLSRQTTLKDKASEKSPSPPAPPDCPDNSPLRCLLDELANRPESQPAHRFAQPSATAEAVFERPRSHPAPGLKSVAYFGETLSRLSSERQFSKALAQVPENAGPMNSQHLILQALGQLRDIAPDYLQAFITYADTLLWLDQHSPVSTTTREHTSSPAKTVDRKPRASAGQKRRKVTASDRKPSK